MNYKELEDFFRNKNTLDKIKKNKDKYSINNSDFLTLDKIHSYLFRMFNITCKKEELQTLLDTHCREGNNLEKVIQDRLAFEVRGRTEIQTPVGRIDILTDREIIEVKKGTAWKHAIGQVNAYSEYYPSLQKRIHLYGKMPRNSFDDIYRTCENNNIRLTYESD